MITSRSYTDTQVNGRRTSDREQLKREKFCSAVITRGTDIPLHVKQSESAYFLSLPLYATRSTEQLMKDASPVYVTDRASAIAVLVSRKGKR